MVKGLRLETGSQPASQTERPFPGGPVVKPFNLVLHTVLLVSVVCLVANAAFGQSNVCSASARGALRSCQAGARSDYLLALAKCTQRIEEVQSITRHRSERLTLWLRCLADLHSLTYGRAQQCAAFAQGLMNEVWTFLSSNFSIE
jgi:hypothetical protein